jgi:hypothetical protein
MSACGGEQCVPLLAAQCDGFPGATGDESFRMSGAYDGLDAGWMP